MKIKGGFLCLVMALSLSGCGCVGYGGLEAEDSPQQKWVTLSLSNYDYEIKRQSYSTAEYTRAMRVSVRNGEVQSAVYLDDSTRVSAKVLKSLRTVDEWFAYIEKGRQKPFFRLDVTYHKTRGHPTYIHADVRERVADDELTVRIQNLLPI